jgi:uncharacterized XkdX family phage protein
MTDFERIKFYYDKGWCSKEQLRKYVEFGVITIQEYELICGEVY